MQGSTHLLHSVAIRRLSGTRWTNHQLPEHDHECIEKDRLGDRCVFVHEQISGRSSFAKPAKN